MQARDSILKKVYIFQLNYYIYSIYIIVIKKLKIDYIKD